MPKLSVIIPTHNRAALLPRTVESVWRAGTNLEVIVVDDASSDDTPRVCGQLKGIRYVRLQRQTGAAGARNAGIMESRAEYLAFVDDDDLRLPGSLDVQLTALEAKPHVALVYGRVLIGDAQNCLPTGESYPVSCPTGDVFWSLLASNFIPMLSVVVRKQHLIEAGLFDASLSHVMDWDMWLRVSERFSVTAVEEPVAIYRKWNISSNQLSSNRAHSYHGAALVQERALLLPRAMSAPPARRRQVRRHFLNRISDALIYEAVVALEEGHARSAWAYVTTALRLRPLCVVRPGWYRSFVAGVRRNIVRKVSESHKPEPSR